METWKKILVILGIVETVAVVFAYLSGSFLAVLAQPGPAILVLQNYGLFFLVLPISTLFVGDILIAGGYGHRVIPAAVGLMVIAAIVFLALMGMTGSSGPSM